MNATEFLQLTVCWAGLTKEDRNILEAYSGGERIPALSHVPQSALIAYLHSLAAQRWMLVNTVTVSDRLQLYYFKR